MGVETDWKAADSAFVQAVTIAEKVAKYRHAQLSAVRLGSGASTGFLGAEGDCGGRAHCARAGCAFDRSCRAAAHDSICPAARLGSAASTGFLGAEGESGGRTGCTRAECAFARSCPAATQGSVCPAARLGSLGADGGSQGHRRPAWVGGNGYALAARAR
jgi:hypothetical protein